MRRYCLIGRPLGHSFSARYFAEKFAREGLSEVCRYDLCELPSIEALPEMLRSMEGLVGFNVTIPYKQQIIPYLDAMSDEARAIGAVNCVRVGEDGSLVGYNTDVDGIRLTLDRLLDGVLPEKALVLGTGGASQAVQYVLRERGIACRTVSRDKTKGDITYDELSHEVIDAHRLIINTSPVGMYPHHDVAPTIPYEALGAEHYLFDLVYNPERTLFVERGAEQGAHATTGLAMLYAQAEAAWQIWNE